MKSNTLLNLFKEKSKFLNRKEVVSNLWFGLLGVGVLVGLIAAFTVAFTGLGVYNADDVTFWVVPMSGYLFFALTAAGLTFLSSLPSVFGMKEYYPIAERASVLAGATLLVGVMCKALDLGPLATIFNMTNLILSPNLYSPVWWMAILYVIYIVVVIAKFYFINRIVNKHEWHSFEVKMTGISALLLMFMSYAALSIVFSIADARPAFSGHFTTIYFAITGITSGIAVLILALHVHFKMTGGMPAEKEPVYESMTNMFKYLLGAALFVFIVRAIIGFTSLQDYYDGFRHMAGTLVFNIEFLVGLVIPLVILSVKKYRVSKNGIILASGFALVGMFFGRLSMLLSAQVKPVGNLAETRPEFVTYYPSVFEVGIIVLALSLSLLIYSLVVKFLKLETITPE